MYTDWNNDWPLLCLSVNCPTRKISGTVHVPGWDDLLIIAQKRQTDIFETRWIQFIFLPVKNSDRSTSWLMYSYNIIGGWPEVITPMSQNPGRTLLSYFHLHTRMFYNLIIISTERLHLQEHVDLVEFHVGPWVPTTGHAEVMAGYVWGHCTDSFH